MMSWLHKKCKDDVSFIQDLYSGAIDNAAKISNEVYELQKQLDESNRVIARCLTEINEGKSVLDYTLFEKNKEIDQLKKDMKAVKRDLMRVATVVEKPLKTKPKVKK